MTTTDQCSLESLIASALCHLQVQGCSRKSSGKIDHGSSGWTPCDRKTTAHANPKPGPSLGCHEHYVEYLPAEPLSFNDLASQLHITTYFSQYATVTCSRSCPSSWLSASRASRPSSRCSEVSDLLSGPPLAGHFHPVSSS